MQTVYIVGLLLVGSLALYSVNLAYKKAQKEKKVKFTIWIEDWLADFSTEMVGAFITALVFGLIVTAVQDAEQEKVEKNRLIYQLGSTDNRISIAAAEELIGYGWLRDGTLRDKNLIGANLQSAFLKSGDFERSLLNWSNLRGAFLMNANLQGANLFAADACGAVLAYANLQNANLHGTNLQDADLNSADLRGANLLQANLQGATIVWTNFDEKTILPDGSHFDPNTDDQIEVFTNPKHPNFHPYYDTENAEQILKNENCKSLRASDRPR